MMVKRTYATVAFTPSPPKRLIIITFPTANPIPPNGGQHTKIQIHTKQHPVPFCLVCDFESFLTPSNTVDDDEEDDVDASSGRIHTIDEHNGFCCYRSENFVSYRTRRRRNSTSRRSHPMAQQVTSSSAIWSIPTASTTPIMTIRWSRNISRCHETCSARSL